MLKKKLSAQALKAELWDTLLLLRNKKIPPTTAVAISIQSREIMRIVRAEMAIANALGDAPSRTLISMDED